MGDQHKWFKLWTTAPSDDGLQALPADLRWAWAALGCYTKAHGTRGRVTISPTNAALAGEMCVKQEALIDVIKVLPHVHVEEGKRVNGEVTVTWENWRKYQEDSTVAQRVRGLRSKRRGEEIRGDKRRGESPLPPNRDNGRGLGATKQTAGNAAVLRRALERDQGDAER